MRISTHRWIPTELGFAVVGRGWRGDSPVRLAEDGDGLVTRLLSSIEQRQCKVKRQIEEDGRRFRRLAVVIFGERKERRGRRCRPLGGLLRPRRASERDMGERKEW
ncbi:hypothetical protein FXO38_36396 [Capsicum annuum]|nr:hypothetical protein FXO37_36528 [Capsicum annuum]KAF3613177.1 hypothetical protein FXO38_36396 [Capsicum annuum]